MVVPNNKKNKNNNKKVSSSSDDDAFYLSMSSSAAAGGGGGARHQQTRGGTTTTTGAASTTTTTTTTRINRLPLRQQQQQQKPQQQQQPGGIRLTNAKTGLDPPGITTTSKKMMNMNNSNNKKTGSSQPPPPPEEQQPRQVVKPLLNKRIQPVVHSVSPPMIMGGAPGITNTSTTTTQRRRRHGGGQLLLSKDVDDDLDAFSKLFSSSLRISSWNSNGGATRATKNHQHDHHHKQQQRRQRSASPATLSSMTTNNTNDDDDDDDNEEEGEYDDDDEEDRDAFRKCLESNPTAMEKLQLQHDQEGYAVNDGGLDRRVRFSATTRTTDNDPSYYRRRSSLAGKKKKQSRRRGFFLSSSFATCCFRLFLIDIPVAIVFGLLLLIYVVNVLHDEYYTILFDRSTRTDHDLMLEHTYYERHCNEYDLSTRNTSDLLLTTTTSSSTTTIDDGVDRIMKHGTLLIPDMLQPGTIQKLRDYLVYRNRVITPAERYPMSQGYQRLSYGLDASEDAAISTALAEIVSHEAFYNTLTSLLGDVDPASAEITAITAYAGCEDQSWHPDTKPNGNAIKFARTYSHSYSLFIPLQDTTYDMGATDICPGTHYCTNDVRDMCERNKIRLSEASEQQQHQEQRVWKAGYGALLNQHVWHRGGAHTDDESEERVVFIVSFLARPNFGSDDSRQLSRGTYFHQKWNMWGHTLADLQDATLYMMKPYSILRCLHLWKPNVRERYGYDLITSGYMRFSNEQLEDEDIYYRLPERLLQLGVPPFLHGELPPPPPPEKKKKPTASGGGDDDDAVEEEEYENDDHDNRSQKELWTYYIRTMIRKISWFVIQMNVVVHGVYAVGLVFTVICYTLYGGLRSGYYVGRSAIVRILLTHGTLAYIVFVVILNNNIRTSDWGQNIRKGYTLARPFPTPANSMQYIHWTIQHNKKKKKKNDAENIIIKPEDDETLLQLENGVGPISGSNNDLFLSRGIIYGKTTWPRRNDILIGTRYDATFLGAYDTWLQYHPANKRFHHLIQSYAPYYFQTYYYKNNFTPTTKTRPQTPYQMLDDIENDNDDIMINYILDLLMNEFDDCRFLFQNYHTGDWRIMSTDQIRIVIQFELLSNRSPIHMLLTKSIRYLIAKYRFQPRYRSSTTTTMMTSTFTKISQTILFDRYKQIIFLQQQQQQKSDKVDTTTRETNRNGVLPIGHHSRRSSNQQHEEDDDDLSHRQQHYFNGLNIRSDPPENVLQFITSVRRFSLPSMIPKTARTRTAFESYKIGTEVWVPSGSNAGAERRWSPGTIMDISKGQVFFQRNKNKTKNNGSTLSPNTWFFDRNTMKMMKRDVDPDDDEDLSYRIAMDDGRTLYNVPKMHIEKVKPIIEGDNVMGCFRHGMTDCYSGIIQHVWPNGEVTIVFDDGDIEYQMSYDKYYIPPYKYIRTGY